MTTSEMINFLLADLRRYKSTKIINTKTNYKKYKNYPNSHILIRKFDKIYL